MTSRNFTAWCCRAILFVTYYACQAQKILFRICPHNLDLDSPNLGSSDREKVTDRQPACYADTGRVTSGLIPLIAVVMHGQLKDTNHSHLEETKPRWWRPSHHTCSSAEPTILACGKLDEASNSTDSNYAN